MARSPFTYRRMRASRSSSQSSVKSFLQLNWLRSTYDVGVPNEDRTTTDDLLNLASPRSLSPTIPNEILLRDLPEWRIAEIAGTKLRAPYHQEADIDKLDPRIAYAKGISRRLLINLAVNRFDGGAYNVTFLLDTGSPITSLSPESWSVLGLPTGHKCLVNVGECRIRVEKSTPDTIFHDINLLGQDAMKELRLQHYNMYDSSIATVWFEKPEHRDSHVMIDRRLPEKVFLVRHLDNCYVRNPEGKPLKVLEIEKM
ncbi:hypothetical protein BS50DRAFT_626259 [Corynespora cassiicola Philippines]|uniref:Uncharacterized protein n=1 Tax=Corynespora cassiicola Philippines TaxID=1448308 RepID=A0A2T2N4K7_CORCC|nr:hypothetical protein BS50DRAFT_626259 [Corynespora cassiicola Philippines]